MHLSKFFETKEFLQIQLEWRTRLRDEGFKDIEHLTPDARSIAFIEPSPGTIRWPLDYKIVLPKQSYYEMAGKFLWDFSFKKPRHRLIWELHARGFSVREIAIEVGISAKSKSAIHKILKKIQPQFFKYIEAQNYWDEQNGQEG